MKKSIENDDRHYSFFRLIQSFTIQFLTKKAKKGTPSIDGIPILYFLILNRAVVVANNITDFPCHIERSREIS